MASRERRVTVAVVSYNTRELLIRSLESLAPDVRRGLAEVYVVDNCSTDGSAQAAATAAPWAQVVEAGANLGFGSAVNLVAAKTDGEWLLAANGDVALEPGALEALMDSGVRHGAGCVAPRLVLPAGDTEHSVHPFPTVPLTLAFNLGLHRVSPRIADRLCLERWWDHERPRTVPWAIGACLLLRRKAFDSVGGFDERQWMYAEDLDLQWRMRRRGWSTWYEPTAIVRHASGASAAAAFGSSRRARFLAATYTMLRRRRGAARMWATATINIAGAAGRAGAASALAPLGGRWPAAAEGNWEWLRAHVAGLKARDAEFRAR